MKKLVFVAGLCACLHSTLFSQHEPVISDTSTLELSTFVQLVKHHHPVAKQSDLLLERAHSGKAMAWGAFDPEWVSNVNQKYFAGDKYYSHIQSGVKIPTWFGIELSAGYRNNEGLYLNPENTLPETGIFFSGISIPLGKDLFIDKRRTELEKANYYITAGEIQQQLMLNDLLYESVSAYWSWFESYNKLLILDSSYVLAVKRFEAVKMAYAFGDRPSIDTLEAFLQVQNRHVAKTLAEADYVRSRNHLAVFLWYEGSIPVELESFVHPPAYTTSSPGMGAPVLIPTDSMLQQHPEIKLYENKTSIAGVDQRYYREQFKPQIDLKYEALSAPAGQSPLGDYSPANYAWGIEFSFPLLLQTERAQLELANITLEEIRYAQKLKTEQIKQKWNTLLTERMLLFRQYELQAQSVAGFQMLTHAESILFNNGESSLFMINTRENDLVLSQLKLVEILTKYQKTTTSLLHTQVNLYENL